MRGLVLANHGMFRRGVARSFLPLDSVTTAACFSLQKLRTAYAGSAIRVRRSSDNVQQDIGFVQSGPFFLLDTAALTSFIGANSGFIVTWYDQSGNARNLTQATAASQPRIVNAGTIDTLGGKPTALFLGAQVMVSALFTGSISQCTANAVMRNDGGNTFARFVSVASSADTNDNLTNTSAAMILNVSATTTVGGYRNNAGRATQTVSTASNQVFSSWFDATNHNFSVNGNAATTSAFTAIALGASIALYIGNEKNGTGAANYALSEMIWIHSVLPASTRQALERAQGSFYGITVA